MEKLGFPLSIEDDWPPYDVEHLWLNQVDGLYQVKNFPFFLKGVAYDDVLSVDTGQDGYVDKWELVTPSHNSLMWILYNSKTDIVDQLINLGCGVEINEGCSLIAVNIPKEVSVVELDSLLKQYEDLGIISVAVPVDRIGLLM
ncbi:MAG TPA: DUF4265 domain-containing protein [Allosphingosinicella sp.]|nr:DUF4265 domain-containing protein [Allosphingosinicella sp.]